MEPQPPSRTAKRPMPRTDRPQRARARGQPCAGALCGSTGPDMLPLKRPPIVQWSLRGNPARRKRKAMHGPPNPRIMVFFGRCDKREQAGFPCLCKSRAWDQEAWARQRAQPINISAFEVDLRPSCGLAAVGGEIRGRKPVAELGMADFAVARGLEHGPVSYTHLRAHETVLDLVC